METESQKEQEVDGDDVMMIKNVAKLPDLEEIEPIKPVFPVVTIEDVRTYSKLEKVLN